MLTLLGAHYFLHVSRIRVKTEDTCGYSFHHHHISVMELGHLLTRSALTYPEVSSKVCHDSFRQLGNSVSLPWVIYYGAFYLHVVYSFSCIPVICLKLVLFLIPLQEVYVVIVYMQPLVSSLSAGDCLVHWLREVHKTVTCRE